ncbi:hypothetical protein [Gehongia tenuis]|uniref:Uncharacterized protein n=1 Tax=Gehongia tenuis TaxID=2763655 RepID=A0A926D4C0_9FIRM|nr:hypothetical protein [Gehongia tenuis]MBC8530669.1 hypothetical protein [Gehongia tenuis]
MHFIGNLFTIYDQSGEGNIDRTIIECLLRPPGCTRIPSFSWRAAGSAMPCTAKSS